MHPFSRKCLYKEIETSIKACGPLTVMVNGPYFIVFSNVFYSKLMTLSEMTGFRFFHMKGI